MGTDHDWVAIRKVVEAGLRDAELLASPPVTTEEGLGDVADTVTDHLAAALASGALVLLAAGGVWLTRARAEMNSDPPNIATPHTPREPRTFESPQDLRP